MSATVRSTDGTWRNEPTPVRTTSAPWPGGPALAIVPPSAKYASRGRDAFKDVAMWRVYLRSQHGGNGGPLGAFLRPARRP